MVQFLINTKTRSRHNTFVTKCTQFSTALLENFACTRAVKFYRLRNTQKGLNEARNGRKQDLTFDCVSPEGAHFCCSQRQQSKEKYQKVAW